MVRWFPLAMLLLPHFEVVTDCGGPAAPPVADQPADQLSLGGEFGCAVKAGVVSCWGANVHGQLGRGVTSPRELGAAPITTLPPVAQLAAAATTACARTTTGRVFCWGSNESGQLGTGDDVGTLSFSATPVEVVLPVPIAKLATHSDYVLALGSDGRLFGWGNDSEGTLGRGDENPMTWPVPTPVVRAAFEHLFVDVSAGQGHACGVDRGGALWCWGRNTEQQLGTPSTNHQERAPVLTLDGGVTSVVAGAFGTCAVQRGELVCWSELPVDNAGQLLTQRVPAKVELGGEVVRAVDTQWFHVCAVTTSDALWCWGRGIEGQLGLGELSPHLVPQRVTSGVRAVATGFFFTCLQRTSGVVECMGENADGQLGLGDTQRRDVPTPQP